VITHEITITLPGTPTSLGSLKCIGQRGKVKHQLVQDFRPGQARWQKAIVETTRTKVRQTADQYEAVGVEATFTIARPSSHFGTGRNEGYLNVRAPLHPTTHNTNDIDKMVRLVLDALQSAGLLVDDAQVVEETGRKSFPLVTPLQLSGPKPPAWGPVYEPLPDALPYPGARIRVYPVSPPTAPYQAAGLLTEDGLR